MYDLIIIGAGPGGTAGAVYAARKRMKTVIITPDFGGQSVVSEGIENWIGAVKISGADLASSFKKHVEAYKDLIDIKEGLKAISVKKNDGSFSVTTDTGEIFEGKSILISTGSGRKKLEALGAERLEHKGLTYCASCDGPLFAGQPVAVIGGGNAAFETAAQLLAYCENVTMINRSDKFRADPITVEKILSNPKIKSISNAQIVEIKGEKFVDGLTYKNIETGEIREINVKGIFVEIGQIPNTDLVKDLVNLDEYGRIIIDPWNGKTSLPGIWAAGDCTNILYHQNNIAAGDAVKAIEDLYLWLHTSK